jgi:hypothetical protein
MDDFDVYKHGMIEFLGGVIRFWCSIVLFVAIFPTSILAQPNYNPKEDTLYRTYLLATVIGVVGGLFGIGFIIWQTVLLRRAADAAKASADALINSERAWLMVDLQWEGGGRSKLVNTSSLIQGTLVEKTAACVDSIILNNGRSPAWIIEKRINMAISENIPPEPELQLVPVSDPILEPIATSGKSTWHAEPGCKGKPDVGKITIIFGMIKYRDIFNKTRETRFGYMVSPGRDLERIPSYPEYNKYT